jgi:TolB protein
MAFRRVPWKPRWQIILPRPLVSAVKGFGLLELMGPTFFSDVYVWFPDGRIQRVSPSGNGIYYQPHIHPDGSHVVFYGNETGPPRVWKADLGNGDVVPLTPPDSGSRHPAFSWDGSQIAFASDRASGQEPERIERMHGHGAPPSGLVVNLFVMDANGQNVRQVTFGMYQDQRPCFSPDGKTLVFVSNRGGGMRLWSVPVDKSADPRPLQSHGWGYRPYFSTDGQWVFFFTDVNERHQICKITTEGGKISPLVNDDRGTSHGPFADPNGEVLLMHSIRGGKSGIWELPLDGSPPRSIQPPGFEEALHPTRAKNGVIAFDVPRRKWVRIVASRFKRVILSLVSRVIDF